MAAFPRKQLPLCVEWSTCSNRVLLIATMTTALIGFFVVRKSFQELLNQEDMTFKSPYLEVVSRNSSVATDLSLPSISNTNTRQSHIKRVNSTPTQVLLFTYMRGGSSLFGEVFNKNADASYWFEPLNGLYSALYGHMPGWRPLDILLRTSGHPRDLPDFESSAILDHLSNILRCNISALPQHIQVPYSTTRILQDRNKPYSDCLKQAAIDIVVRNPTLTFYNETFKCLDFLSMVCPSAFRDNSDKNQACYHNITMAQSGGSGEVMATFKNYAVCMRKMAQNTAHCLPHLSSVCSSSSLIAIKVIRMHASLVRSLMERNPSLKVIHLLRDPRGIVISRKNAHLISHIADKKEILEAKYLCDRMNYDIGVFKRLGEAFPGRILSVKYEDLVQEPVPVVNYVYDSLGRETPQHVLHWFQNSMSGSSDTGMYGTMRMRSEHAVFSWKEFLREPSRSTINDLCAKVISHLADT